MSDKPEKEPDGYIDIPHLNAKMRDIKFRVYDTEKKKLSYGFSIQSLAEETVQAVIESWVDNLVWQQYTGLKDKNGVEIYEGDIIIFDNSDIGGQRYKGIVEWNTDPTLDGLCFGLFIPPKFGGKSGWLHCDFLGELEVVGNIFEGVDR